MENIEEQRIDLVSFCIKFEVPGGLVSISNERRLRKNDYQNEANQTNKNVEKIRL